MVKWLNHRGFETCLPVWVGVPRRSLWSWLRPRGHRPNHGRQRIEQKELHTQNYLGGNDPVDLDHPNVCPTSHLGGSSSISSKPRFCPGCTTAVREEYSKIDTPKSWWWWFYPHLHHHYKMTTVTQKNVVLTSHWKPSFSSSYSKSRKTTKMMIAGMLCPTPTTPHRPKVGYCRIPLPLLHRG